MSRATLAVGILAGILAGLGTGYWLGSRGETTAPYARLPATRSKTVPEGFAPPGLMGEVRDVLLEPDIFVRTEALARQLEGLGPDSLEPVRDAYESVLLDIGDIELVLFGEWWAGFDPRAALKWTHHHWNTRLSVPVLKGVMRAWGRSDPLKAMGAAIGTAPNGVIRRRWVDSVLRGWDESVHDGALSFAQSLGPGPDRQWALSVVSRRRVMRDGHDAVIAWVEDLPDDDDDELFKLNAYRRVAAAVAEVDPQAAIAFAEKHLDGAYGKGLALRVGMQWVKRDPEGTMRWLSGLSPGKERDDGVMESYRTWLGYDRAAAQAWIPKTEHDGWLDPAVALYARSISLDDTVESLRWASGIANTPLRERTVGVIARRWLMRDEAAASTWLEQADLPEKLYDRIATFPKPAPEAGE
jgi:hypothetical protein